MTKRCSRCRVEKPLGEFHKDKSRPGGHAYVCKSCKSIASKQYRVANPGKAKAQSARYYREHREVVRARHKKYYSENREKCRGMCKRWNDTHADEIRQYMHEYYEAHRDKHGQQMKLWWEGHPEKQMGYRHKRRRLTANASGEHSGEEWFALLASCNHSCMGCGKHLPEGRLEQDHVVALSKGGSDDIHNILPLCVTCNRSKGVQGPAWYHTKWQAVEFEYMQAECG